MGSLGKIVGIGAFSYLLYEGYEIYSYCACPAISKDIFNGVAPQVDEKTPVKFTVSISQGKQGTPVEITSFTATNSWTNGEDVTSNYIDEKFRLPATKTNQTVTLHLTASVDGVAIARSSKLLSRFMIPENKSPHKRNLWEDPTGEKKAAYLKEFGMPKPVASIPPIVEVGFVSEQSHMDPVALLKRGFSDFIDKENKFKLPVFVNTLVVPRDQYKPASEEMVFEVRFHRISFPYWNGQRMMTQSFEEAEKIYGLNEYDADSFKQLISGPSPWKLITVYGVAFLHFIFEYLVITADIAFWKQKTSFEGLSHHSVAMQIGMKLISVLYVIEDGKTKLVLYFVFARMALECWKLMKMLKAKNEPWAEGLEEMRGMSHTEIRWMKILFIALMPFVILFAMWRLTTQQFKSWYSFFILTLTATSQTFGFVVMMPQVFLNYRLKSVEHLPWRALSYQAVNTFVDDIFTLCIRMPEVVKYSVFRDDIVFIICVIQRQLYKKRRGEDEIPGAEKKKDDVKTKELSGVGQGGEGETLLNKEGDQVTDGVVHRGGRRRSSEADRND